MSFDKVLNISSLEHRELTSSKTGERYSLSAVLTDALGLQKLFVHHEILHPGRRASSPHSHSAQEEMVIVLEGHPTAHVGERSFPLGPGDAIGFPPSESELHYIENQTAQEVRLLVIASKAKEDQVSYSKARRQPPVLRTDRA